MEPLRKRRLAKERKKWVIIFLICLLFVSVFSPNSFNKNLSNYVSNPITLLKTEQENPIRFIFTKFFTPKVPDKFKEYR